MLFLTIEDFEPYIREIPKQQITGGDDTLFDPLELNALSIVQSFTGRYFEADCLSQ